jgi:hypothetical protein
VADLLRGLGQEKKQMGSIVEVLKFNPHAIQLKDTPQTHCAMVVREMTDRLSPLPTTFDVAPLAVGHSGNGDHLNPHNPIVPSPPCSFPAVWCVVSQ